MDAIQNYGMHQNTAFQGARLDKAKTLLKNQKAHLIIQGIGWGASEAFMPSTNMLDVIIRKICIDVGEFLGHKMANNKFMEKRGMPQTSFNITNRGFNIISYIKLLKDQAAKLF